MKNVKKYLSDGEKHAGGLEFEVLFEGREAYRKPFTQQARENRSHLFGFKVRKSRVMAGILGPARFVIFSNCHEHKKTNPILVDRVYVCGIVIISD
jgi:hypothetical protein